MLGTTVVVVALVSAAAALAVKPKSGNWKGTTSQTFPNTTISGPCPLLSGGPAPVCFKVSSAGSTIVDFEPAFEGSCTKAGSPPKQSPIITTDAGRNVPITNGKFHTSTTSARIHSGSVTLATASDQLHGKFTSKTKASGTYSVTFKFNNNAAKYGLAGYSCKTGTVSWTATAP